MYYVCDPKDPSVVIRATQLGWSMQFETFQHIKKDTVGDVYVSTVFLGLDHRLGSCGDPVLWETMMFFNGDEVYQRRYTSHANALVGHQMAMGIAQRLNRPVAYLHFSDD